MFLKSFFNTIILNDPPTYFKVGLEVAFNFLVWFFLFYYFKIDGFKTLVAYLAFLILANLIFKVYKTTFRYFNVSDLLKIFFISLGSFVLSILITQPHFAETHVVNLFFSSITILIVPRLLLKILFASKVDSKKTKALIYGAGENGIYFKRAYQNNLGFQISGFIDDDNSKVGKLIDGVPIMDLNIKKIKKLYKNSYTHVIISTDNFTIKRKNYILRTLTEIGFIVYRLPNKEEIINQSTDRSKVVEFSVDQLLSRDEISIDFKKFETFINGKTILVTGGAGSIGSEIINQLKEFKNLNIIGIDNSEFNLFNAINKFKEFSNIQFYLKDITDKVSMDLFFENNKIDIIFNAAAYKHVPIFEDNPYSGFKNNVLGCSYLVQKAVEKNIEKFVLVSSDKAVNPTNLMGASKRICEAIVANTKSGKSKTVFLSTRFGNVLDSSGSVVPTFKSQIAKGGPITITDLKIERYFMTIPEASKLVLEATRIGKGSQIYVFDMGEPVKIYDLAKKMLLLSGLNETQVPIIETGLRKGEKLYEELFLDSEVVGKSDENPNLLIGKKVSLTEEQNKTLNDLITIFENGQIVKFNELDIKQIVPEYNKMS
ncbi:MAG: polysaccharide biosynthesis protein [Flavobacteriaceae bacterium]|nr:polysaccharide biosynthesis protein [Flavobacteriaceae bacterium]